MRNDTAAHNTYAAATADTIAVIGGGIAGLTAAWELARAGRRVALYEREQTFGGRIRAERIDLGDRTLTVDVGAEAFATRGGGVAEFITELGMSHRIVAPEALGAWLVRSDRQGVTAAPLPPAGSFGIPARPLTRATRRTLGNCGALRAAVDPLLPARVGSNARTLAELVKSRLGSRTLERLVRPVVRGVQGVDPEQLHLGALPELADARARHRSLLAAARSLRASATAAGGAVAGLRGGMHTLVDRIVAELTEHPMVTLHPSIGVSEIRGAQGSWQLTASGGQWIGPVAGVLLAASAAEVRTPSADPHGSTSPHQPAAPQAASAQTTEIVVLVVEDARLDSAPRGTGALVAREDIPDQAARAIHATALTHATAKWPALQHEAGPDRHVLRLSYDAATLTGFTHERVLGVALADASAILGITVARQSVLGTARATHRRSALPGQRDASRNATTDSAARLHPGDTAECPGIVRAGDTAAGTGLASVIPQARAAVAQLLTELPAAPQLSTQKAPQP